MGFCSGGKAGTATAGAGGAIAGGEAGGANTLQAVNTASATTTIAPRTPIRMRGAGNLRARFSRLTGLPSTRACVSIGDDPELNLDTGPGLLVFPRRADGHVGDVHNPIHSPEPLEQHPEVMIRPDHLQLNRHLHVELFRHRIPGLEQCDIKTRVEAKTGNPFQQRWDLLFAWKLKERP